MTLPVKEAKSYETAKEGNIKGPNAVAFLQSSIQPQDRFPLLVLDPNDCRTTLRKDAPNNCSGELRNQSA